MSEVERVAKHNNGNVVCSIDLETTGPDPTIHEIIQIAILPVDGSIKPLRTSAPFYINVKPDYPEMLAGSTKTRTSKAKLAHAMINGFEQEAAKGLLYDWIEKLKLPTTKWGTPKQIYPLGHNFAHDRGFLIKWLGYDNYNEFFGPRILDTMVTALYLNDRASFHGEQVPFHRVTLTYLCTAFKIDQFGRHDALVDAKLTAEVYRKMCKLGLF